MSISAERVREAAASAAIKLAGIVGAPAMNYSAAFCRTTFLAEFDAALGGLVEDFEAATPRAEPLARGGERRSDQIPEKPPGADPNAEAEALAAEIVASANLAARPPVSSAKTEGEALADEIIASAAAAGGRTDA
jgi:hypothetical protein